MHNLRSQSHSRFSGYPQLSLEVLLAITAFIGASICILQRSLLSNSRPVSSTRIFTYRWPAWTVHIGLLTSVSILVCLRRDLILQVSLVMASLAAVVLDQGSPMDTGWLGVYLPVSLLSLYSWMNDPLNACLATAFLSSLVMLAIVIARVRVSFHVVYAHPPTAEYSSSLLPYIFFSFLDKPLFRTALAKGTLEVEDVPGLFDFDMAASCWGKYSAESKETTLIARLFLVCHREVLLHGVFALFSSIFMFVAPLALERVLWHVSKSPEDTVEAIVPIGLSTAVICIGLGPFLTALCESLGYAHGRHAGVQVRAALQCALYKKLLRLDPANNKDGAGTVTNLLSTDCSNILNFVCYSPQIWTSVLQIVFCSALLYAALGVSALGGVLVMLLALPMATVMSEKLRFLFKELASASDARIRVINELLHGIRVVKLFAWEKEELQKVAARRATELGLLQSCIYTNAYLTSLWAFVVPLVAAISFVVHTQVLGLPLTPAAGFTSLTLFNLLKYPLTELPSTIKSISKAIISLARIRAFLGSPEVAGLSASSGSEATLQFNGAELGWVRYETDAVEAEAEAVSSCFCDPTASVFGSEAAASEPSIRVILQGVTVSIGGGELAVIVGKTGSGKSSLVNGMLGECRVWGLDAPLVMSARQISYAPQASFIQSGSLRDNILFGSPFDRERYRKVLWCCALDRDIELLPGGDATQLGEKGVNLSGGQQQRVSLARAAYARSDIIVMDDILSAVDVKVGEHIFRHLICGFLKDRTRVLVTHNLSLVVPKADTVIVVKDMEVIQSRSVEHPEGLMNSLSAYQFVHEDLVTGADVVETPSVAESLIDTEVKQVGSVGLHVYWQYLRACGGWIVGFTVLGMCAAVSIVELVQNIALGRWMTLMEFSDPHAGAMLSKYLIAVALAISFETIKAFILGYLSLQGSRELHELLIRRVIRAPMSWFERTPVGRILNRFSQDIQAIDCDVMNNIVGFIECGLCILQIVVIVFFTLPSLLFCFLPVAACTTWIAYEYVCVSRELKRLESISRSPILVQFGETFQGLPTLRAYSRETDLFHDLCGRIDVFNRMHLYLWLSNRWLNVRMALLGAVVAEIVAVAVVYWYQDVDGASAGLVILYSLTFTENLNLIARMHAECQMLLNSVERVKEYSAVEQERYQDSDINSTESRAVMEGSHSQMKNWPSEGAVEFKDVCLSYSSSASDVLRSVSFSIEAGQKVGIVGRSGAGKSSCIAALFRMQEPRSGSLAIDGVEVLNLPLQLLRSRIAIVPQDPILFGGSVRSNLDPFHQYNDEELWAALRSIKLDEFVKSLPGQALDTKHIAEKGSNLSAGQKQLLCMARALVKRSRVLVMDEATASVDHETDALIQDTINKLTCTVICIAHRLHTVSSFQKVVVMREGRVHESGSPLELLRNNDSLFKAMAISSGDFEGLYKIAVRNSTKLG